ncbi:MAG: aminoglycoside 3'-phosphotransferase [Firmicutes bacterium]|nr:aminoglycoside 3'-phosphotransferase [Bacillota bacterium]
MTQTPITIDISRYPAEFHPFLSGAKLYDSSCSPRARVIFIDKDTGYFLKSAPKGTLERQAAMTRYFHGKGLSSGVISYISNDQDWLLAQKINGDDCTTQKYLDQPERLVGILAERMAFLHSLDFSGCPVQDHTTPYLAGAERNYRNDTYDKSEFPDSFGYKSPEEAWAVVEKCGHMLQRDTLLHGDYCLPNVMLDDWQFSGFIDLDNGGVGDKHVDIFWTLWSMVWNLKTDKYHERFRDVYGRNNIDEDMLCVIAAIEVFG